MQTILTLSKNRTCDYGLSGDGHVGLDGPWLAEDVVLRVGADPEHQQGHQPAEQLHLSQALQPHHTVSVSIK